MARVVMLLGNPFTHDARVLREASALVGAGHNVTVLATAAPGLEAEETLRGVHVRRLPSPGWISATGPRRAIALARWYERYEFLAAAAAAERPDVVHGHDLETLLAAGRVARHLGVPHIHDDHELGLEKLGQLTPSWLTGPKRWASDAFTVYLRARGARVERQWIARAAAIVTVSERCAEVLRERYGREPVILRNLPEASDLAPDVRLRERAGLASEARVVLYQGSITEACAPDACVAAAASFPPGWHLIFLGATWMRPRLEADVAARGLAGRVRFLDPVPPSILPGFTAAADVGLAPVRVVNDAERFGLSNKVFEYMHAGLLTITSAGTAQGDLIARAAAGLLLEDLEPGSIAEAVRRVADMGAVERRRAGASIRARAREEFSWETEASKLIALYERVLASPRTPS